MAIAACTNSPNIENKEVIENYNVSGSTNNSDAQFQIYALRQVRLPYYL